MVVDSRQTVIDLSLLPDESYPNLQKYNELYIK